ncbi:FAD-dependent oxidoreductase [Adlercreutzia sp. ZJ141]|uniref:FAD-dependent oxidoreductase n=1 Tax=Adlercreutzia sp. ZJ141 TaxID=2709406 RepID=UPI0013ECB918|nr:FAD-dependent oxidoreductase [Adlercreutzia sp. ZJ141]
MVFQAGKMRPESLMHVSRRSFLTGAAALGIVAAGSLSGCTAGGGSASDTNSSDSANEDQAAEVSAPTTIDETIDVDVVVVGAGISGLSAAVQASENGLKTLVLEKGSEAGGNGVGTEGIFGVDSAIQKDLGIEIEPADIIRTELEESQWRSSGALWYDLVSNSADNIEWLKTNGVEFSGVVDNYHTGLYETMHWWKGDAGAVGYVPQMQTAAEKNGAEFRFSTPATALIFEEDTAKGVFAQDEEGKNIQVNAKAVILCSGGIGANAELLPLTGMPQSMIEEMQVMCVPTVSGDGYNMARSAGCKSNLNNASIQAFCAIEGFPNDTEPPYSQLACGMGLVNCGFAMWVDQDGMRFTDESIGVNFNVATPAVTCMGNRESYVLFTQEFVDTLAANPDDKEYLDSAMAATLGKSVFEAETIEELADMCSLPKDNLSEALNMYNGFCEQGFDGQFGKPAEFLKTLSSPPYYAAKISSLFIVVDGSIATNIRAEVLNENSMPISGLYAAGLDGAMLWHNIYTQNMPGSCVGNNVHTGRVAANSAKEYIG